MGTKDIKIFVGKSKAQAEIQVAFKLKENKDKDFHREWHRSTNERTIADVMHLIESAKMPPFIADYDQHKEEIDLKNIDALQAFMVLLADEVGNLLTCSALASKIGVSKAVIKRWVRCLEACYYCFTIRSWVHGVPDNINAEKLYLWDWSIVKDKEKRMENLIAVHLLHEALLANEWFTCDPSTEIYFLVNENKRTVAFLQVENGDESCKIIDIHHSWKDEATINEDLEYYKAFLQESIQVREVIKLVHNLPHEIKHYNSNDLYNVIITLPISTFLTLSYLQH